MLLSKEDLPNLGHDTKDQIFKGKFNLYKISSQDIQYALVLNQGQVFILNNIGAAIEEVSNIAEIKIESQVYFKNAYSDCINLNIAL